MQTHAERMRFLLNGITYSLAAALSLGLPALIAITVWRVGTDASPSSAWESVGGALLGALVGSMVPLLWQVWRRHVERTGEVEAILVESRLSEECMRAMLNDGVMAPLYRLPTGALSTGLPKILGDGILHINYSGALVAYLNELQEINRGLDRCGAAHAEGSTTLQDEFSRLKLKVRHLLEVKQPRWENRPLADQAFVVLCMLRPFDN